MGCLFGLPSKTIQEWIMKKIITSFFIAASLLITAPSAFAARGDAGYQKHNQHQGNRHQRSHEQSKHISRHQSKHQTKLRAKNWRTHKRYNQSGREKQFNKSHRSSRHDSKHGIRKHGTRKNGYRYGPRKHIRNHDRKHYPRRHHNHRYYNDHDSWFLDFFTVAPFYTAPVYNVPVYSAPVYAEPVYAEPVYEKTYKTNIWDRQKNQQRRINSGLKNGQLTQREARLSRLELHKIRDRIAHFKADGHFSHYERKQIQRMLDRSSDFIYKRKHNSVTRYDNNYSDNGGYDYYH